jgi:putative transposase
MPWKERKALEERRGFIAEWQRQEESLAELCRRYEISRPTGYKLIERFEAEGEAGVAERSRAAHHRTQAMSEEIVERIVALRREHARWGPRKLRAYLIREEPEKRWPAASSIGELLGREGLTVARRRRRHTPSYSQPLGHAEVPNQVWCTDFKGWFLCGNGERCDPLTITDACSRYLHRCRSVEKTDGPPVRAVFEAVFREYGLPDAIRSDNGPPFASPAPAGLSRLAMWWLRLGIRPERIAPGCPEQNGRHERMHQTLKQETATPPAADLRRQQEAFRKFEREYNQQRPHEALGNRTPGSVYVASARTYPARLPELVYPEGVVLRRISHNRYLKWSGERTFISEVLSRENVGLLEIDEDLFEVYYGPLLLGWLEGAEHVFEADRGPQRRHRRPERATEAEASR